MMKPWIKIFIIVFCLTEIAVGAYAGAKLYDQRQKRVLGETTVIDKNKNGPNAVSPLMYYLEPLSNLTETDKTPWVNGKATYTYNFDTMNDRFNYLLKKPPATYRIIALGDSFTFGVHVNTADSWPEKLEDLLNAHPPCTRYSRYEVLNLGVNGFDIQNEVERFRLRGQKYNPDLVIWLLIENDFTEVRELMEGRVIELYNAQDASKSPDQVNPWNGPIDQATKEFHEKYSDDQIYRMQDGFFSTFNQLYPGRLLLTTFPYLKDRYKSHMQAWVHLRPDTYYFDGLTNAAADPNLSLKDWHPNATGHARIAEDFYENLVNNNMIPCTVR